MKKYEAIVAAIRSEDRDVLEIQKMFWAAERGIEYPLSSADRYVFMDSQEGGEGYATAANLESIMNYITDAEPSAAINLDLRPNASEVSITISLSYGVHLKRSASGKGGIADAGITLLACFCEIRPELNSWRQKALEYMERPEDVPHPSTWPIERCADGRHRAISREHEMAMQFSGTSSAVSNSVKDHPWNPQVMFDAAGMFGSLVREEYIDFEPETQPDPEKDDFPSM